MISDPASQAAEAYSRIDLSIITVSWNVCQLLRDCLQSVEDQRYNLNLEMIVVDAGSSDGSPAMVRKDFPWVKLIESAENLGFPRGNNMGIRHAQGRHILLLNPDTLILEDALSKMVKFLDQYIGIGGLGAQLLNADLTVQSSRRRFPTFWTALFESTWLQDVAPKKLMQTYYAQDLANDEINDVDWVTGACLMVPKRVIDHVGLLDEAYFMYSEELDWCRRIKEAGWRIVYFPEAKIVHYVGKSSEQAVTERHINFQRAKLRYFRKYHGRMSSGLLRIVLLFNYLWQMGIEAAKGVLGHKRSLRIQRVRAYWRVIRSGLRPAGY
ncbi:MAG: glycosyltransferase family 2 protein [Candidatus Promineifilaceae bacterium]|nr:glycosyltransferase family 2 protein [Candidatus Promineifilaceae bacterium]